MSNYVDTNGIRLHYLERPGDGPTILLAPGLAASAYFYEALLDRLSPRLHVIAFDLRGRGASDRPETGYSMADHAADMIGAMDAFGLERVVFGGHSFGGLLTYVMAADYPDRVERGVVIDAPAEVDPTVMEQIKPTLDRLETTFPSWEQYIEMVKGMPYYADWEWDPALEVFYRSDLEELPDGGVRSVCRPEHISQAMAGTLEVDWDATVRQIEQPILFVRAMDSFGPPGYPPIVPEEKAKLTMDRLQNGRYAEFPGNHITFLFGEGATVVADEIVEFVIG
jgi:pimeloyl-ACP methyl ester carboxylesterase